MEEIHKAIILGKKVRKLYHFREWYGYYAVESATETIERIPIFEGEIENPVLKAGEYIYIEEFNKTIQITRVARNIEGGYVYYVNYEAEMVEDEISAKSKVEAENKLEEYKKEKEAKKRELEEERGKNLKLYQKLFSK